MNEVLCGWAGYAADGPVPAFVVDYDYVACFQGGEIVSSSSMFGDETLEDMLWCAADAMDHGIPVLVAPEGWGGESLPDGAVAADSPSHAVRVIMGICPAR